MMTTFDWIFGVVIVLLFVMEGISRWQFYWHTKLHHICYDRINELESRIAELERMTPQFTPKRTTIKEALEACKKWQLTDEELEELLK